MWTQASFIWRPDWTTRFSHFDHVENLVVQSGRLEQSGRQMKLASVHIYLIGPDIWPKGSSSFQNLVAQEPSGHPLGRQSIWSPIRSPEHLVVNLVVVDAFSISIMNHFFSQEEADITTQRMNFYPLSLISVAILPTLSEPLHHACLTPLPAHTAFLKA